MEPVATLDIRSDIFFARMMRGPRIAIGESYVAGDWETDDLVALLKLLALNLEDARKRPPLSTITALERFRLPLPERQSLHKAEKNIHYHYDVGNEFFRLFLDDSMTYSCAYFASSSDTLEEAQRNKHRQVCEKLRLSPGEHVLEIGCGWGSFAIHAARECEARVTGITISRAQYELARERVREAGVDDKVEILYRDYREMDGVFDKIASIEMLEAIGHEQYPAFFATLDRLLAPEGLACIQTIAIPSQRYEAARRRSNWIREYIFPGGLLPSLAALTEAMTKSSELDVYSLEDIGIHYARTLREWRETFNARIDDVRGLGYDRRFERIWDFYLAFCEAGFEIRALEDLQLVLTRPFNSKLPSFPSERMTF